MKRAAIYVRVSTANQEDEETIENQLGELRQRIKQDGHLLLPECEYKDDGWTGTLLERPDLDRLRSDAKDNVFDILYFYDRGRIARRFVYQEVVLDELQSLEIECISLHDINGNTDEERLMGGVMGIFHEYERIKITERMRLGKMRKVRDNKKLLGYNPKYGYDYHPRIKGGQDARDGYVTVNEKEADATNQIFEWFVETESIREVIRRLYEAGIPPKKQKRMSWTKGPVVRLLRDTTYIGEHYYNKSEAVETKNPKDPTQKYRRVKKNSRKVRPKEEWLMIKVPRIVSTDIFKKAQIILDRNQKFSRRNNSKNEYLLTGVIDCECGKPRTGDPASNGHLYYRCTDRLTRFPLQRQCHAGGVNASVLDKLAWNKLKQLLSSPKLVKQQADRWLNSHNASPAQRTMDDTNKVLSKLNGEERRYAKAYGTGYLSERLYKEQMNELNEKRSQLQNTVIQAKSELANRPKLSRDELVAGVKELLGNLDFTDKKAIIRALVTKVKATQEEVIIWGQLPVLVKAEVGFEPKYRNRRVTKCW